MSSDMPRCLVAFAAGALVAGVAMHGCEPDAPAAHSFSPETERALARQLIATCQNIESRTGEATRAAIDKAIADAAPQLMEPFERALLAQLPRTRAESARRAQEYLEAAEAQADPEVARLLYLSALSHSEEKSAILQSATRWTEGLIDRALAAGQSEEAELHLTQLAALYDAAISSGSLADIQAIPSFKEALLTLDKRLTAHRANALRTQEARLGELEAAAAALTQYEEAGKLLTELEGSWDATLEERCATLRASILRRQSCLTTAAHPLLLPEVDEQTPWCDWLNNFATRLQDESGALPLNRKIEDLGTAAALLAEARTQADGDDADVAEAVRGVERAAAQLQTARWQQQLSAAFAQEPPNMSTLATLLAEAGELSPAAREQQREGIIRLNKAIVSHSLDEMSKDFGQLRDLKEQVSIDLYTQLLAARQNQFLQILPQLQELESLYPGEFADLRQRVIDACSALESTLDACRKDKEANLMIRNSKELQAFAQWAQKQMSEAEKAYNEGTTRAAEWLTTESNEQVQQYFRQAWKTLIRIHPGDLSYANPALRQNYDTLKTRIETKRQPSLEELNEVSYVRISHFPDGVCTLPAPQEPGAESVAPAPVPPPAAPAPGS